VVAMGAPYAFRHSRASGHYAHSRTHHRMSTHLKAVLKRRSAYREWIGPQAEVCNVTLERKRLLVDAWHTIQEQTAKGPGSHLEKPCRQSIYFMLGGSRCYLRWGRIGSRGLQKHSRVPERSSRRNGNDNRLENDKPDRSALFSRNIV
jgi:hypothetical protein